MNRLIANTKSKGVRIIGHTMTNGSGDEVDSVSNQSKSSIHIPLLLSWAKLVLIHKWSALHHLLMKSGSLLLHGSLWSPSIPFFSLAGHLVCLCCSSSMLLALVLLICKNCPSITITFLYCLGQMKLYISNYVKGRYNGTCYNRVLTHQHSLWLSYTNIQSVQLCTIRMGGHAEVITILHNLTWKANVICTVRLGWVYCNWLVLRHLTKSQTNS